MRKIAREIVFMLIYEEQFNENRNIEFSFDLLKSEQTILHENKLDDEDEKFIRSFIEIYEENKSKVIKRIDKHLFGYESSRVFKVDNALLCLAVSEIFYLKTPAAIVINEVVELAKKYSTDKSAKFINGILGAIIKEIWNQGNSSLYSKWHSSCYKN